MPWVTRETAAAIDAIVAGSAEESGPGVALAVLRDGEVVHARCQGLADLEAGRPVTEGTVFHVASMSKQFTAFAAGLLADRGRLDLDAGIGSYLPWLPGVVGALTVRQLLHHTGGLRDQWGMLLLSGWRIDDVITTDDVLDVIGRTRELNFPPGTDFCYSNAGYTLVGEAVRAVTGQTLRQWCEQEMFAPLGMRRTHFHDDYTELVPDRARSYSRRDDGWHHAVLSYSTVGPSSLHTTVGDLARWERNFAEPAVGSPELLELMHRTGLLAGGRDTGYAFGLMVDEHRGRRRVHHAGGDAGFRTNLVRFPDDGFSVVALSNCASLNPVVLSGQVADLLLDQLGRPAAAAAVPATAPATGEDGDLARFAGLYCDRRTGQAVELSAGPAGLAVGQGAPLERRGPLAFGGSGIELEFVESGGQVAAVDVRPTAISPQRLERTERADPTAEDLAGLVGTYWGEELGQEYQVAPAAGGGLELRRRRLLPMPLRPTVTDGFSCRWGDPVLPMELAVLFERDGAGVTGLRLSTGRIDRVHLRRRESQDLA